MTLLLCLPVSCLSQGDNWPHHIQVQRLNDSYIDVYYNTPKASEMPILIFCQGSGYDSNTAGFLGVMKQFEEQVVGLAIEKQGVNLGDSGDTLTNEYLVNNRIENRLYDYLRVLQYLRTHVEWWEWGSLYHRWFRRRSLGGDASVLLSRCQGGIDIFIWRRSEFWRGVADFNWLPEEFRGRNR